MVPHRFPLDQASIQLPFRRELEDFRAIIFLIPMIARSRAVGMKQETLGSQSTLAPAIVELPLRNPQKVVASMNELKSPMGAPQGLESRKSLVQQVSAAAGETWARWWRAELENQGRAVAGGWPGTLSEARARVLDAVIPEMRKRGIQELSFEERELAAKTLYATARRRWLSHRER